MDAEFRSSCCRRKRTATRAKFCTFCVELKGVLKNSEVVDMTPDEVADDGALVVVVEGVDLAIAFTTSLLWDWPSKVTSAFSDMQERFAELNRASNVLGTSGILKFDCASEMRRGMA